MDEQAVTKKPISRRKLLAGGAALGATGTVSYLAGRNPTVVPASRHVDVAIVGGGVMGAMMGVFLKILQPNWRLAVFERLDAPARESSGVWHNAGTGHSALCEPNYTPIENGRMKIDQAIKVNEQFQVTRQLLASLVRMGEMRDPRRFINSVPHMGFGMGRDDQRFQLQRYRTLTANPLWAGTEFSADRGKIAEWAPALIRGRDPAQPVAATWNARGTDVNWGEVTEQLMDALARHENATIHYGSEVEDLDRLRGGAWRITYRDRRLDEGLQAIDASRVFNGAGGAALLLLQASGIPEARNYGGFPVGGSFIVNDDPAIADRYLAKAYGRASGDAPPMSVPHLDTRYLDGRRKISFGPFATFSTAFLMQGGPSALFRSINGSNVGPSLDVAVDDFGLVKYLLGQLAQGPEDRLEQLRTYYPEAPADGWNLVQAGQRVQIIRRRPGGGGDLAFGTELVSSRDGSLISLLGASPGASTAPSIVIDALRSMFPQEFAGEAWQRSLRTLVPTFGMTLHRAPAALRDAWAYSDEALQLRPSPGG
ncbi:malate dehydrogenase (quinone) [Sphingomonas adhaesiva]|uniref:malate dehydrogenase (quinone) n=1 Tax=Sphingomonas adhaesiva TaxID=28212 RepID=UPI002FFD2D65